MINNYSVPGNLKAVAICNKAIVYFFPRMKQLFSFRARHDNANSFFEDNCLDCYLRNRQCFDGSAYKAQEDGCYLDKTIHKYSVTEHIDLLIPEHVVIMKPYERPSFFYYVDDQYLKPLNLGNVDYEGGWCNGDIDYDLRDIRDIYNKFWFGIHNSDLTNLTRADYTKYIKDYAAGKVGIYEHYDVVTLDVNRIKEGTSILGTMYLLKEQVSEVIISDREFEDSYLVGDEYYVNVK